MNALKRLTYDYSGYISGALLLMVVLWFIGAELIGWKINWKLVVTTLSVLITAAFLVQRQKLQETELFHTLFSDFNHRYDQMNECLADVKRSSGDLTQQEKAYLIDYFNLCAEEHLFHQRGYIPQSVWLSWRKGMAQYMEDDRISELWCCEKNTGSYYGLTMPTPTKAT
jgi:hypothetical protein